MSPASAFERESPFDTLIHAWRSDRPIIPFLGAGISAATGIPLSPSMTAYLAKVYWCKNHAPSNHPAKDLVDNRWPDFYELNERILQGATNPGEARGIVQRVLKELKLEREPNQWLVLLQQLCDGKQELKDRFFSRLERDRKPATAHQFAAFLTGLMGWPMILTTNFDTLLERALRAQSIHPSIYEIPEGTHVPDPDLIRSTKPALVKVHGGAHGRLMSESLMYSLSKDDFQRLIDCLPRNPLILVMGYGGGDRRVMCLLEALVGKKELKRSFEMRPLFERHCSPRMLWIYRDKRVESIEEAAKGTGHLVSAPYRNGGRFLQELYCRAANTHPVSETYYRAFTQAPPITSPPPPDGKQEALRTVADIRSRQCEQLAAELEQSRGSKARTVLRSYLKEAEQQRREVSEKLDPDASVESHSKPPVAIYTSSAPGSESSMALVHAVRKSAAELIWYDLEPISTLDSLLMYLQNRFRRFDPGLEPFALLKTQTTSLSSIAPDDPRVEYVVRALKRGKYVLALDSLGEFGTSFQFYMGAEKCKNEAARTVKDATHLHEFLDALIKRCNEFGESRLLIAHTGQSVPLNSSEGVKISPIPQDLESFRQAVMSSELGIPAESLNDAATAENLVETVWKSLCDRSPASALDLALASCFRRPRDLVAMRRLLTQVQGSITAGEYGLNVNEHEIEQDRNNRQELDRRLRRLAPLVVEQEGGLLWMHGIARKTIYRNFRDRAPGADLAKIHDFVANYYYSGLFRPSNDPEALFEYVFHRLLSLQNASAEDQLDRLHDLTVVLVRERDLLLSLTHPGSLFRCIDRCREFGVAVGITIEDKDSELKRACVELRKHLCELKAESARQASLYQECIQVRMEQLPDRLQELGLKHETIEVTGEFDAVRFDGTMSRIVHAAQRHPHSEARESLFRLFDHIIEIAHSRSEQGESKVARQILEAVDKVLEKQVKPNCKRESDRIHLRDTQIRCIHRLMEANLRFICAWKRPRTAIKKADPANAFEWTADEQQRLEASMRAFERGRVLLQKFTRHQDRVYSHYLCALNTMRARAAYLDRQFGLAYRLLDSSRAAIRRPRTGSEHSAIGIVLLHQAECLMVHSNEEPKENATHAKLVRTRALLKDAQSYLEAGRPQIWAWTWLRLLHAQLEHEELASLVWKNRKEIDLDVTGRIEDYFRRGLTAISLGLSSCKFMAHRKTQFVVLWQQLAICYLVERALASPSKDGNAQDVFDAACQSWRHLLELARLPKKPTDLELPSFELPAHLVQIVEAAWNSNRRDREWLIRLEERRISEQHDDRSQPSVPLVAPGHRVQHLGRQVSDRPVSE